MKIHDGLGLTTQIELDHARPKNTGETPQSCAFESLRMWRSDEENFGGFPVHRHHFLQP